MTTTPRPLTDLIGLDPNFTGGLSPEEHLRRQRCGECDDALKERDAARKELDKTRAELDDKTSEWEVTGQFMADWVKRLKRELAERTYGPALEKLARDIVGCGADDVHPEEEIAVKWSRLREVLANPATTAEPCPACVGTKVRPRGDGSLAPCRDCNGTGLAGVRSHAEIGDRLRITATTAEPADEPKATCPPVCGEFHSFAAGCQLYVPADRWRGQQATDCGRGVLGGWCLRPVGHEGDCSPKSRRLALPDAEPAAS